jgi:Bacterial pre-peptidase C-terminal domain
MLSADKLVVVVSLLGIVGCGGGGSSSRRSTGAPVSSGSSAPTSTAGSVAPSVTATAVTPTAPEILGIRWPAAREDDLIRIRGEGFDTAPNGVTVYFAGGVNALVTALSQFELELRVPFGATSGDVVVESLGLRSSPHPFTVWGRRGGNPAADDHGDDANGATRVTLSQPTPGRTDFPRDEDWFAVDLSANQAYAVRTLDLSHGMDTILEVRDDQGSMLAINDDGPGLGFASAIDFTPTRSGTYYVMARSWQFIADSGTYAVLIQPASAQVPPSATNTAPQVTSLTTPQGVQQDAVTFSYTVVDPDNDPLDVMVGYRVWSTTATRFDPATVHVSSAPHRRVASGAVARTYTFTWDSRADVGAASGQYQLEIQLGDGRSVGPNRATAAFDLSNPAQAPTNTAPLLLSVGTPQGTQSGAVLIPYVVSDAEGDAADIEVRYMSDASQGFRTATLHLTSSATNGVSASAAGDVHSLVWDSLADLGPGSHPNVILELTAFDAQAPVSLGIGRTTGSFAVNN